MERTLSAYVRALRTAGAAVSSAEAIDAARAMALVGYADRTRLKDTLGLVLAKSEDDKQVHAELFELFFGPAGAAASGQARAQAGAAAPGGQGDQAGQGGQGSDPADAFMALANQADPGQIAATMARAGAAAGIQDIRFATQTAYYVRKMLEQLGVAAAEQRLLAHLAAADSTAGAQAQAQAQAIIDARQRLAGHARVQVEQSFAVFGRNATENFMNEVVAERAMGQLSGADMARMKQIVARMAKRLAERHARRQRVRQHGKLDLRRTLRANAGHDGVPFDLVWKTKHHDRPKIVAICDVSGSVAPYVQFLLLFLHALKDHVADLEAFAFSAELHDVSPDLQSLPFEQAFEQILRTAGGGGTDYGVALAELQARHWDVVDRRTTVLVLGDGRSNHADPRIDIFQALADRAKRLVWLCPEPPGRWGSGDSCLLKYQPHCTRMSHCASAVDLERALDEMLMAYV